VRAAITLVSGRRLGDMDATQRFYNDKACGN
jgi:hypothetical protein